MPHATAFDLESWLPHREVLLTAGISLIEQRVLLEQIGRIVMRAVPPKEVEDIVQEPTCASVVGSDSGWPSDKGVRVVTHSLVVLALAAGPEAGQPMSEPLILTERRGKKDGILWMTLNRPEKLNALTLPLLKEMRDLLVHARFDRSIRCIVITGAGRGFCAGMDMGGNANPDREPPPAGPSAVDPEGYRLDFRHETETLIALRRVEVPIVAMINGPAVGAGFDLTSHCDLAVGSTAARYQVAYVKRGVYAGHGGFWSLPKILGWRKATELMTTGRFMSAQEAHEAGLTNYLVEPRELEAKTMELALELEAGPPIAQKLGKLLAMRAAHLDFDTAMQWSESAIPVVGLSRDSVEGMQAFGERRETDFQGR